MEHGTWNMKLGRKRRKGFEICIMNGMAIIVQQYNILKYSNINLMRYYLSNRNKIETMKSKDYDYDIEDWGLCMYLAMCNHKSNAHTESGNRKQKTIPHQVRYVLIMATYK